MDLYAAPNAAGDAVTAANNFQLSFKDPVFDNGYVMKFDHRFSDHHAIFVRYSWREFGVDRQGLSRMQSRAILTARQAPGVAFDDTFTLNPTTVLNFRYGLGSVYYADALGQSGGGHGRPGLPFVADQQLTASAIPQVTVSNGIVA
jgi:hypothetical protein